MSPTTLNLLSHDFWSIAAPLLLKATLLLTASLLASIALRRSAASSRHLVWTLGIAGVLLLPLLTASLPAMEWQIGWLNEQPTQTIDRTELVSLGAGPPLLQNSTPARIPTHSAAMGSPAQASTIDTPSGLRVEWTSFLRSLRDLDRGSVTLLIWEFGLLSILVYFGLGRLRLRTLERGATEAVDPQLALETERLAREIGLRRAPRILCSAEAITPMTWGMLQPVLLLPAASAHWRSEQRRDVLLHELHHVKRRDAWTQGLAQVACALLWFHPLVWMADRSMRRERERACDDQVLMAGSKASSYANHLLTMARSLRCEERTAFASVAMARRSELSSRLLAVLDPQLHRDGPGRARALAAGMLAIALLLPLAALRPVAEAAPPERPRNAEAPRVVRVPRIPVTPRVAVTPHAPVVARVPAVGMPSVLAMAPRASGGWHLSDDDGRISWQMNRDGDRMWVEMEGEVEFAEDEHDVTSMEEDAYFEIGEGKGRNAKHVEIEIGENGDLVHSYYEGRKEKEYDDAAREWLAEVLPRAVRNLGINAKARTARIYEQGGVDAFLRELDELDSDFIRSKYYATFLDLDGPTDDERREVLRDMALEIDSDYERAELLISQMPRFLDDPGLRETLVEIVPELESDYERSRVLQSALSERRLSPEQTADLLRAAQGIDSDYEARQVLGRVHAGTLADPSVRSSYFGLVDRLGSDWERSQLLQNLLQEAEQDPELARTILDAASEIDSDYEKSQVLAAFLQNGELDKQSMLQLIEIADGVDSEYERANLLIEIAQQDIADEEVREALLHAIDRIDSEHDYSRAMRALRRNSR